MPRSSPAGHPSQNIDQHCVTCVPESVTCRGHRAIGNGWTHWDVSPVPGEKPHPAEAQGHGREACRFLNRLGILLKRRDDFGVTNGIHHILPQNVNIS